ncbi:MAG: serine/threonine-protein kinase PknK [Anaerolineales bacterium]
MLENNVLNNRYQLGAMLGEGGMGEVYQAYDRLTGETVALKRVWLADAPELRLALSREFRILAALRHPHIINVQDYGFDPAGNPFYTMHLIPHAPSLLNGLEQASLAQKVEAFIQLLQALRYLHRHHIIHHDLKPTNILLDAAQGVQMLDFGLAHYFSQAPSSGGTLAYLAPELLRHAPATPQSDLYAVGVMLFEALTGSHPYHVQHVPYLMEDILASTPDIFAIHEAVPGRAGIILAGVVARLLVADPTERYTTPGEVIHDLQNGLGLPSDGETDTVRESFITAAPFVGREDELAMLRAGLFDLTQRGRGGVWLVGGESGSGKTRLVGELRTYALADGARVLTGQGVAETQRPFAIWRDVLRGMVVALDLKPHEGRTLKAILPDVDSLTGQATPPALPLDSPGRLQALAQTIRDVCARITTPTLIILEDLHWALDSLGPLQALLPEIADWPVMIVATFREEEAPRLRDRLSGAAQVTLKPMPQTEMAQYSRAVLGERGTAPQVVAFLARQTEGNVFFLTEVVRALAESAGKLAQIDVNALPDDVHTEGITALLRRRLARLPEWVRAPLRLVAVAGHSIDGALLARWTPEPDRWRMTCADYRVIHVQDGEWQFLHDKLRRAILASLPEAVRAGAHRQVAKTIEAVYPDHPDYAYALYEHWQAANDPDQALRYLEPVAWHMVNISADYPQAKTRLQRGLANLPGDDPRVLPLLLLLSRAHERLAEYELATDVAERAIQAAHARDDLHQLATALNTKAIVLHRQAAFVQARAIWAECLSYYETLEDTERIVATLNNLGAVSNYQGEVAQAQQYYTRSLDLYQTLPNSDNRIIATVLHNLSYVYYNLGDFAQATTYMQRSHDLRAALHDYVGTTGCLNGLGIFAHSQGDYASARRYFEEVLVRSKAKNEAKTVGFATNNLGMVAYAEGDLANAEAYFYESIAIKQPFGDAYGLAYTYVHLGFVHLRLADPRAYTTLQEALRLAHQIAAKFILLESLLGFAWWAWEAGDRAQAAALLGLVHQAPQTNSELRRRLDEVCRQLGIAPAEDSSLALEDALAGLLAAASG